MMKASFFLRVTTIALALAFGATSATAAGPEDTVGAFNAAFMAKDKDALVATLAEGGAQFTLRSQHEEVAPDKVQSEIAGYWTVIAPVLFASTSSYQRTAEVIDTRISGDIATVWTNTKTNSTRLGQTKPDQNEFTEVYLVVKTSNGWKIAAIADNRIATALPES